MEGSFKLSRYEQTNRFDDELSESEDNSDSLEVTDDELKDSSESESDSESDSGTERRIHVKMEVISNI